MEYDLIIIGAGPAGYVAAIRAGQLGLKTAIVEKKHLGGMCLNWGCIPSKAMIESAKFFDKIKDAAKFGIDGVDKKALSFNWKKAKGRADRIVGKLNRGVEHLVKKNNVEIITGAATIVTPTSVSVNNRTIEASNIMIATGSFMDNVSMDVPSEKIVAMNKFFDIEEVPESIAVYGHGPVVVEMAQFLKLIGKEVKIILTNEDILPGFDDFLKDHVYKTFKADKIPVFYQKELKEGEVEFDLLLNCSWRKAVLPHSEIKINLDSNGYIEVNEFLQTNHPNIYAVGDVNGKSFLAHPGSAQGLYAVNHIKGIHDPLNLESYPLNLYANPEIAQIGKTEQQLKEASIEYKVNTFPMSANGKALIENETSGFIRMLSDKKYGEVLGVQIVAPNATDLISEASAYMSLEATVYDVANTIHAHPTISEVFMEAGFDAVDKPVHM